MRDTFQNIKHQPQTGKIFTIHYITRDLNQKHREFLLLHIKKTSYSIKKKKEWTKDLKRPFMWLDIPMATKPIKMLHSNQGNTNQDYTKTALCTHWNN